MSVLRCVLSSIGVAAVFVLVAAPAGALPPPAKIEAIEQGFPTLKCGDVFKQKFQLKNTGGTAYDGTLVFNGTSNPLKLAQGEEKIFFAEGGTFDCTKPIAMTASVAAPAGASATPLYTRTWIADKLTYKPYAATTADGTLTVSFSAKCGQAGTGTISYTYNGTQKGTQKVNTNVTTSGSVDSSETLSVEVEAGTPKTYTMTKPMSCVTVSEVKVGWGSAKTRGKLDPEGVSYRY